MITVKVSELAARAGVSVKTVRYYEQLGLLAPRRAANGYRIFAEHDVRIAREVRELNALGIPVERTRPFVDCLENQAEHRDECPASLVAYRDAIDELTERIDAMSSRRSHLIHALHRAAHRQLPSTTTPPPSPLPPSERPQRSGPIPPDLPPGLPAPDPAQRADHVIGRPAPALGLHSTTRTTVRLDDLGPGRTVIYCYPLTGRPDVDLPEGWDTIPGARGCTNQACDIRDHCDVLREAGAARVFGLSSQSHDHQRELVERLHLPFPVLSDPELSVADQLDLPTLRAGGSRLYARITLVLVQARVEHVFFPVFPPDAHAREILHWLLTHPEPAPAGGA